MLPISLQPEQFAIYPPQARALAVANIATLRQLPLSFLPSLLREIIDYDYKFPAERAAIDRELQRLATLSSQQLQTTFAGFAQIVLSPALENFDWVNHPSQFVERQTAHLWSTHQIDAFRDAALRYGDELRAATPAPSLPVNRLGIAVIGQGVAAQQEVLFRNLRPHGVYFSKIKADNGFDQLLAAVEARAQHHPSPFAHWYVDGGPLFRSTTSLTTVSYDALSPMRISLLQYMQSQTGRPGMGPEELRTNLAQLTLASIGMASDAGPVLDRFQLKLFTEGSGTQIFSTTFAQWATRESLRRAEPLTLLVRYTPRQRQKPMDEMLSPANTHPELDPLGSLVDADFAAYYHWINQQRLPSADRSAFLVWFEDQSDALVIAPSLPRGTQSDSALDLKGLFALAST